MSERLGPNFAPGSFALQQSIRLVYMLRALSRGRNRATRAKRDNQDVHIQRAHARQRRHNTTASPRLQRGAGRRRRRRRRRRRPCCCFTIHDASRSTTWHNNIMFFVLCLLERTQERVTAQQQQQQQQEQQQGKPKHTYIYNMYRHQGGDDVSTIFFMALSLIHI